MGYTIETALTYFKERIKDRIDNPTIIMCEVDNNYGSDTLEFDAYNPDDLNFHIIGRFKWKGGYDSSYEFIQIYSVKRSIV